MNRPLPILSTFHTVQFSETDMAGIVHFSNFYRYMEQAEAELFKKARLDLMSREGIEARGWPRVKANATFKHPLRFGDTVEISIEGLEIKDHSLEFRFGFYTERDSALQKVAVGSMTTVHAKGDPYTGRFQAALIPEAVQSSLMAVIQLHHAG